jgi:hypothetical protein
VMISGDFETRVVGNPAWVTVPFECAAGNMTVQIVLSQGSPARLKPRPL